VHFKRISDSVKYTKAQYDAAMEAMVEGAALAVLIVFVFLRDWRSTIIAALAIPLSAIPRSEEHTSELQSRRDLVCRLLLEKINAGEDIKWPQRHHRLINLHHWIQHQLDLLRA